MGIRLVQVRSWYRVILKKPIPYLDFDSEEHLDGIVIYTTVRSTYINYAVGILSKSFFYTPEVSFQLSV